MDSTPAAATIVLCPSNKLKKSHMIPNPDKPEITNYKHQITNNIQIPRSNDPNEFDLPQGDSFDLTSGRMKLIRDSRIDMIYCNLKFVLDLSFVI
jgi:hypothetical protein